MVTDTVFTFLSLLDRTRQLVRRGSLVVVFVALIVVGAALFAAADHRTFGTAVYWAITTASTVGYGDVTPSTPAGRVIAAGLMLTAVPVLGLVFANAASYASEVRMRRLLGMGARHRMKEHILVLGWNPRARVAVRELLTEGEEVVLVADEPSLPLDDDHLAFLRADPGDEESLSRAAPQRAKGALICLDDDGQSLVATIALRHLAPNLTIASMAQSERTRSAMRDLGVPATVPVDALVGHALAKSVESPHAGELLLRLVDSEGYRITERPLEADEVGQTVSALRHTVGQAVLLGVVHGGNVVLGIHQDPVLGPEDRLLLLTDGGRRPSRSDR